MALRVERGITRLLESSLACCQYCMEIIQTIFCCIGKKFQLFFRMKLYHPRSLATADFTSFLMRANSSQKRSDPGVLELSFFTFNSGPSKTFAEMSYPQAVDNLAKSPFLNSCHYSNHQQQKGSESEYCRVDMVAMLCPKSSESWKMGRGIHRPLYQNCDGSTDLNVTISLSEIPSISVQIINNQIRISLSESKTEIKQVKQKDLFQHRYKEL